MPWKLKDPKSTPPKGFLYIYPITTMAIDARNIDNWLTLATDHRVANALPLPELKEMEDQLCGRYDEKTRTQICIEYDDNGPVVRLGVGGTLKKMLATVGVSACWGCANLANRMDAWGPDGCEEHMPEIVEGMSENAMKSRWTRYIPFKEMGAEALVRLAIAKVRSCVSTEIT